MLHEVLKTRKNNRSFGKILLKTVFQIAITNQAIIQHTNSYLLDGSYYYLPSFQFYSLKTVPSLFPICIYINIYEHFFNFIFHSHFIFSNRNSNNAVINLLCTHLFVLKMFLAASSFYELWTKRECHAIVRVKYMSRPRRINNGGLHETKDEIFTVFPSRNGTRVGTMHYIWCLASPREQCSCAMLSYDVLTEILIRTIPLLHRCLLRVVTTCTYHGL